MHWKIFTDNNSPNFYLQIRLLFLMLFDRHFSYKSSRISYSWIPGKFVLHMKNGYFYEEKNQTLSNTV